MVVKETLVTPQLAYKWLEGNTHNRSLRQSVVERYARDMKAGKWRLTHEAVAFAPDGTLIDGQHRLWAVIEANSNIKFMVATDVPPESRAVINSGILRTDVDHLKFGYDMEVSSTAVAIVKRFLKDIQGSGGRPTSDEIKRTYDRYQEAIAFTIKAFTRTVRGITTVPVMTAIARAYFTQEREKLAHFCELLCEGRFKNDLTDEPILLLRNYLLERAPLRTSGGGNINDVIYAKTQRALWAYLHGERLGMLYPASSELFPLPEEETTTRRVAKKTVRVAAKRKTVVTAKTRK